MKSKATVFTGVTLMLVATLVSSARLTPQHAQQKLAELQEKEKSGRLKLAERADLAKARGESKVLIPGTATLYPTATNPEEMDQILSNYTVVVAQQTEQKGYLGSEETIRSWHKFKILKTLSTAPPVPSYTSQTPPQEFLPVADDEFMVSRAGGTVTLDGVEITAPEEGVATFRDAQKYLLVLSIDPATRIAQLALGNQSILPVNSDETLYADRHQDHMLQRALREHHENSIQHLAAHLSAHPRQR